MKHNFNQKSPKLILLLQRVSPVCFSAAKNKCQEQQRHSLPPLSCFSFRRAGIIRTALADMDREAREHYTVVIQAKDMAGQVGGLSGSTTINITLTDINDNPPKFPQSMYTAPATDAENAQLCGANAKNDPRPMMS